MQKFKVGDKVKIINYGHFIWINKEEYIKRHGTKKPDNLLSESDKTYMIDIAPEKVGKTGSIDGVGKPVMYADGLRVNYSITFDDGKREAWFSEKQLELI